ncbi:hypothetical protein, partial [Elstera cyanobacteriorum]|uniref:hypothetical protein n=1 Tax=Elstera cyanobacteriorum TaxID=2022747 RepID=UPI0023F42F52
LFVDPRNSIGGLMPHFIDMGHSVNAQDAYHRLQFGRDRTVTLRAKRLDIQCGTQRLILDETEGLLVQASQIRFEEL